MKKFVLLFLAVSSLLAAVIDYSAEGKLWWAHVQYLADDKLEGRNLGTEGYQKAAQYVATEFERAGLKPAGTSGYFQAVKFATHTLTDATLALVRDGQGVPLVRGVDAAVQARADSAPSLEAPMVFVGYGLVIPEAHYDDLAGLDLHGKIAVYVSAPGPAEAPGPLKSHYSSGVERWAVLRKAGAIGIATIANPRTQTANRGGARGGDTPPGDGAG